MKKIAAQLATDNPALLRARLECLKTLVESAKSGIPEHLEKYYKLLTDVDFIVAKINHTHFGVQALINDYDLIDDSETLTILEQKVKSLKLIQEALRLSAHILVKDKTQLTGQLWGRLQCYEMPDIQELLKDAKQKSEPTLLYPLEASLTRPGTRLVRTLSGHTGGVNAVAVTPDGKYVISGSSDNTLIVWNLETGNIDNTLKGHTDWVKAIAVTPDYRVISGSNDKTLKVWNLKTKECECTLTGHTEEVNAVAVTPDGKYVISGSSDKSVRAWNLETGECKHHLPDHIGSVNAVAITPDSKYAIYSSVFDEFPFSSSRGEIKQEIIVCNLGTWERQILNVESGRKRINETYSSLLGGIVAITSDGKQVIFGSYFGSYSETLKACNLESGKNKGSIPISFTDTYIHPIAITLDKRVISTSFRTLKVWNLETGEELFTLEGHSDWVHTVAVTRDGSLAISGSSDKTLKVWDLKDAAVTNNQIDYSNNISLEAIAFTPNGRWLIKAFSDGSLKVLNWELKKEMVTFAPSSNPTFAVTSDSKQIIFGSSNSVQLKVCNLETGKKLFSLGSYFDYYQDFFNYARLLWRIEPVNNLWVFLLFIPICILFYRWISTPPLNHQDIRFYISTLRIITDYLLSIIFPFGVIFSLAVLPELKRHLHRTLAITSNGKRLISASSCGNLTVWNLKTRKKLFTITDCDYFKSVAIIPNSQRVIFAFSSYRARFGLKAWDLEKNEELFTLEGHNSWINAVAVTPDGKLAISGSDDKTLKIWNLETGQELFTLEGHNSWINAVAVTPDGKLAISGSDDKTLKVWDLSNRNVIASFTGESEILCCAVVPNEIRIGAELDANGITIVAGEQSERMHWLRLKQT